MASTAEALQGWLAAELGGTVVRWERLVSGNSRTTWLADVARGDELVPTVVRWEAGDGPFGGTELTLDREARVYRALDGRGVRLPRLYAHDAERNAIALERLPGSAEWSDAGFDGCLREVARLHRLDPDALDLPGFATTSAGDLDVWARIAESRVAPPSPFVDFALAFLRGAHPGEPERLVLCHGDVGIGNFLHAGGETTGLLDWEFAHVGDPVDDLAWVTVRPVLFGVEVPDLARRVREHYGAAPDRARLRYWQAVVVLRNLVTCLAVISNPVRGRDRLVHFMIVPPLNRLLVDALARVAGVELERSEPPAAPRPLPGEDVLAEIAQGLKDVALALADEDQRQRVKRMRYLLAQLAETARLAPAVAAADAAEGPAAADPVERLGQLARMADRQVALYPRTAAMAYAPLPALDTT